MKLRRPQSLNGLILVGFGFVALPLLLAVIWALRELGFQLSALLGAAGLFTVAIGFAAKTSISNLISGLFLIGERPFMIGDFIKVGEHIGEVGDRVVAGD